MSEKNIVVVGAGVAGLTTAYLLSQDTRFKITVVAKHMPGDYDIEYASPWAGANFMPVSSEGTPAASWEKNTWFALKTLASERPDAGIHFQKTTIHNRKKDVGSATASWFASLVSPNPWWKVLFDDFESIPKSQLAPDVDNGHIFTSVCINTAIYLPWLVSQCLLAGVVFKRGTFDHIKDAAEPGIHSSGQRADLVVNCTGLASRLLKGVDDSQVYPARGQIVVVRNEADSMYSVSGTDDGSTEALYIMARAAGGGTILGGCYQADRWESQPDPNLASRIMKRAIEANPSLTGGHGIEKLDVIRHGVGLRPVRTGGARVETEIIDGVNVVHNYGHGGAGYQQSYGSSQDAVELIRKVFSRHSKL